MAAFHDALGGDAEILPARLRLAAVDARLLGGERSVHGAAMRANAVSAPAKGFKIGSGSFDALEMRGVEVGLRRVFCGGHDVRSGFDAQN